MDMYVCLSACALAYLNKCSAVAEMGDCLATVGMGRKLGALPLMGKLDPHVTQCGLVLSGTLIHPPFWLQ